MNKIFRALIIFSLAIACVVSIFIGTKIQENMLIREKQAADFEARFVATAVMSTLAAHKEQVTIKVEETPAKQNSGNFDLYIPSIDIIWEVRDLKTTEIEDSSYGNYGIPPELLKSEEKLVRFPTLAYPGYLGLTAIAGHRDILGAPFYSLDKLEIGDYVYIYTSSETIKYVITGKKTVDEEEDSVVIPFKLGTEELRLITCRVGSTKERLVIFAERVN